MSEEKKFNSEDAKKKAQEIGSTVMTYVDKGVELSKKGIDNCPKSYYTALVRFQTRWRRKHG